MLSLPTGLVHYTSEVLVKVPAFGILLILLMLSVPPSTNFPISLSQAQRTGLENIKSIMGLCVFTHLRIHLASVIDQIWSAVLSTPGRHVIGVCRVAHGRRDKGQGSERSTTPTTWLQLGFHLSSTHLLLFVLATLSLQQLYASLGDPTQSSNVKKRVWKGVTRRPMISEFDCPFCWPYFQL